ncbi:ParB N-terminal domain-containing protein [Nocardioides sp. W3-2-3]|uniref:ParB/RepB/Spo0J family partition protein n=1 Tax=Nocardioides convexus TaxID=2712224 RepID=UPI0024189562|nr:ParB N-terminal domain-containing protein [Nocardioides convexus]NHA02108.1 ParB N-terminal domain-containing protein [Nocardioides convexus]
MTTTQNTKKNPNQATWEAGTLVHVAPGDLLVDRNIRSVPKDAAFKDLVTSIKAHGVQVPITGRIHDSGSLIVKMGQRRTLAAIEAGRETVPVFVQDHDSTEKEDEIQRIVTQRDENHHRSGLTQHDEPELHRRSR